MFILAYGLAYGGSRAIDSTPLWLAWTFDPSLVIGFAALLGIYFSAIGPLRRRYGWADSVNRWQVASFVAGVAVLIIALMSPLDELGDSFLFSMHMVQHMLIGVVAPPLLVLGTPGWVLDPLLKHPLLRRVTRIVAHPVFAFGLFNLDLWLWHLPPLYDATLTNEYLHIVEHLTFMALGVVFWLPVIARSSQIPKMARPVAVLYLFGGCQPMVALGALLTLANSVFYTPYLEAPRIWGIDALADQQLGGLIMWLPSNVPYLIALSVIFIKWVNDHDRAERMAAGEYDELEHLLEPPAPAAPQP